MWLNQRLHLLRWTRENQRRSASQRRRGRLLWRVGVEARETLQALANTSQGRMHQSATPGLGGGRGSSVGGHGEGGRATTAGDSGVGKRKRSVHVRPVSATSTYHATPIAPRPGSTAQHHQAMHNPGVKPVQPKRAPKTCQTCGYLLCGRYKQFHGGGGFGGGAWTCGVETGDHRPADYSGRKQKRFNGPCTCADCAC